MKTHSADLGVPLRDVLPALMQGASAFEMQVTETPVGVLLGWRGAEIELTGDDAGCRLLLRAPDSAGLVLLQDTLTHHFEHHQMADRLIWARSLKPGLPGNVTLAVVAKSERISPSFQRLRLQGDFTRFSADAMHFRLLYGPGQGDLPHSDETGATTWPGGLEAWHRPPYTVRAMDRAGGWIDVDIFIHEGGRVTDWLQRTQLGDRVALSGPGGKTPQSAHWVAYLGDETALPVVARALERLLDDAQGVARIIVPDLADIQPIKHPAGVDLRWIARGAGDEMLTALRQIDFPDENRYVFFAAEKQEAEKAREFLAAAGLKRSEFHAFAYWTDGWTPPVAQVSRLHRVPDPEQESAI